MVLNYKYPKVRVIFKELNFWKGRYSIQQGVISSYNGKRINAIIEEVFKKSNFVIVMNDIFEMTEVLHDMQVAGHDGIHPGMFGGYYGKKGCSFIIVNFIKKLLEIL